MQIIKYFCFSISHDRFNFKYHFIGQIRLYGQLRTPSVEHIKHLHTWYKMGLQLTKYQNKDEIYEKKNLSFINQFRTEKTFLHLLLKACIRD